jgi:hypothetical protein
MRFKKKDVNYKVIMGMHAVGNQCQDCVWFNKDRAWCPMIGATVNPKAKCDNIARREG